MPNLIVDIGKALQKPETVSAPRPVRAFMVGIDARTDELIKPWLMYQFQYNPNEKTDHKRVNWVITKIPGHHYPLIYYSSGGERRIEFKLMINAYEYGYESGTSMLNIPGFGGIKTEIAKLMQFMYPNIRDVIGAGIVNKISQTLFKKTVFNKTGKPATTEDPHQFNPPPACIFVWGLSNTILKCIVEDIVIKEIMWNNWLDPVRAEATVKLIVDERSKWNNLDTNMRRFLSTLGIANVNPFASIPGSQGRLF